MTVQEFESLSLEMLDSVAALARRAAEDKLDWRPAETLMTLGELLEHTASSLTTVVEMIVTGEMGPPEIMEMVAKGEHLRPATPAEAVATVDDQKKRLRQVLAGVSDEQWRSETRTLPWGATGSLGYLCATCIEHIAGHRYQLFVYLKLLGQRIGTMELYNMQGPPQG